MRNYAQVLQKTSLRSSKPPRAMHREISIRFSRICQRETHYNDHPRKKHKKMLKHRNFGGVKFRFLSQKYGLKPKNILKLFKR